MGIYLCTYLYTHIAHIHMLLWMNVCMYKCMCMYICYMDVYIHVFVHICIHVFWEHRHGYISVCMYTNTHIFTHTYVVKDECMYVHKYDCIYTISIYIHMQTNLSMCMRVLILICM